jgi:hypothetical protein
MAETMLCWQRKLPYFILIFFYAVIFVTSNKLFALVCLQIYTEVVATGMGALVKRITTIFTDRSGKLLHISALLVSVIFVS